MEERLSKHRRFQHLSYGGQDVPKLRLSYQAIQLSSSYANFHPHVHRFFGCCIYRCTPILPDNNMLHSPLGFPIRISCGMIGLLLSPSFLDIFTCRLLKAVSDICPYGRNHCSVIWFGTTISDFVHRPKRLLSIAAATTSKVFPAPTSCASSVLPPYRMCATAFR